MKITLSKRGTLEHQGDVFAIARLTSILEACQKKPDIVAKDEWFINDKEEIGILIQMWIDYLVQIQNNLIGANLRHVYPDKYDREKTVFDFPFEKDFEKMLEDKKKGITTKPQKNPHAVALSKLGAAKGGRARADKMTPEQRTEIASKAAKTRWGKEIAKGIKIIDGVMGEGMCS
jgi:hypothetical protein